MRAGKATLLLTVMATLASPLPSLSLVVTDEHPRIFIHGSDLPRMRARVGVTDGTNAFDYPGDWQEFTEEYAALLDEIDDFDGNLNVSTSSLWSITDSRKYNVIVGNLATAYILNANSSAGDTYKTQLIALWEDIIADSRSRNGGSIGLSMDMTPLGKNANWAGFAIGYDYLYDTLESEDPGLRTEIAQWFYQQILDGADYLDRPVEQIDNYYLPAWVADGVFGGLITISGDSGIDQSSVDSILDHIHSLKVDMSRSRELNYCGTYSGYRNERIEEDVALALAWGSATDEDPYATYSYHFANLDDWVMHMCRPNFHESDETGHSHDLHPLRQEWVHYAYPSAVRDANPYTLWFLDQAQDYVGLSRKGWVNIFFNDKSIVREQPTRFSYPLSRYFGDQTYDDGHNSQYTHFRSAWSYDQNESSTVHASYLCGAYLSGHDLHSQGHLAIFRGSDILTASTGIYDGTDMPHTRYWHQAPISENTILVVDPTNTYSQSSDSLWAIYNTEGMQVQAPGTTGGSGFTGPDGPFAYRYTTGFVDRFATLDNGDAYLHSDITAAYPNSQKADLWTENETVSNVTRQITFQHGSYFVLLDRVTSTNPNAVKRIVMHNPDPDGYTLIDGAWNGGVAPYSVQYGGTPGQSTDNAVRYTWERGASQAFATVLYPRPESLGGSGRKLVRIGGYNSAGQKNQSGASSDPSFEFWLREKETNYRWTDQYISSGEESDAYDGGWVGFWRMEIETTGRTEDAFLHVYEVTGAGQGSPTLVDYLEEVDPGHVACAIDDPRGRRVNVYSRDEEADEGVYYRSSLEGPIDHLVTDLLAGVYLVEALDAGESFTVSVAEGLNVASFQTEEGGRVRLTRLSDLAHMP